MVAMIFCLLTCRLSDSCFSSTCTLSIHTYSKVIILKINDPCFTFQSILHSVILSTLVNLDLCQLHKGCYISRLPRIQPCTSDWLYARHPDWNDYLLGAVQKCNLSCHWLSGTLRRNVIGYLGNTGCDRFRGSVLKTWRRFEPDDWMGEGEEKDSWREIENSSLNK